MSNFALPPTSDRCDPSWGMLHSNTVRSKHCQRVKCNWIWHAQLSKKLKVVSPKTPKTICTQHDIMSLHTCPSPFELTIPKPSHLPFLMWTSYQYLDVSAALLTYQRLSMQNFSNKGFMFPSSPPCSFLGDDMSQCLENHPTS